MDKSASASSPEIETAGRPLTRRAFLRAAGIAGLAATGLSLAGCAGKTALYRRTPEETLAPAAYAGLSRDWDPVYGPPLQWYSRYGGPGDFERHRRAGAVPGLDYDVPKGTPLVPPLTSHVRQIDRDRHWSRYIVLRYTVDPSYLISFGHLQETFVDKRYLVSIGPDGTLPQPARTVGRQEIVALSGNSGIGPSEYWLEYWFAQPPHLHMSLHRRKPTGQGLEELDPDRFGIDGGRPVFWDGETPLDVAPRNRLGLLEKTLRALPDETAAWTGTADLGETAGRLTEYARLTGKPRGKEILDLPAFQDLRTFLKKVTLENKTYLPGSAPYSLMLRVLGYSTDERQPLILTLPFIAPGLQTHYGKLV
jgi:hypothetical protein